MKPLPEIGWRVRFISNNYLRRDGFGIEGTIVRVFGSGLIGIEWDRGFGPNALSNPDHWGWSDDYFERIDGDPKGIWDDCLELL